MASDFYSGIYNPDVLSCIANLSNDEVFTPPEIANQMLDMLPQELFSDPDVTFLDPACKSGVFLREIAKRLIVGLEPVIPDLQERVDHVFQKQLYGIAITELTSLLSRRSVYCSKWANSDYSVSRFADADGNIRYKRIQHRWQDGRCAFCGANQKEYDRENALETHAYEIIHTVHPEEIFKMKFDVIISNPPYQLSDGGNAASAMPIYNLFIDQAKKLKPRFMSMVIPARWYVTGRGLDAFRQSMLTDDRIRVLHDFPQASDCFPGVEIKGGVCYFLWDRDNRGLCEVYSHNGDNPEHSYRPLLEKGMDTFIRSEVQASIVHKVRATEEESFSSILNAGRFFGFHTKIEWDDNNEYGGIQTADGQRLIRMSSKKTVQYDTKVYIHGGICWVKKSDIPKNAGCSEQYKVILPRSGNPGSTIVGKPKISEPYTCSSNSYVVAILPKQLASEQSSNNIISYIQTKFFRFLVGIMSVTQDLPPKAYDLVPLQTFSKPWTDEELYAKYNLTDEEISFIESMIKPMNLN